MIPFDNFVTTRLAFKDSYRPCIPKPIASSVGPVAGPHDPMQFGNLDTGALADINASVVRAMRAFPRDADVLPAGPAITEDTPAPVRYSRPY